MGLGAYPASGEQWLGMLGMHGTYEANMAMNQADLVVAVGSRFDDRVTGRLDAFSPNSRKVHIDIDRSSVNKNVRVDLAIIADAGHALEDMVRIWKSRQHPRPDTTDWQRRIAGWRAVRSLDFTEAGDEIMPQRAVRAAVGGNACARPGSSPRKSASIRCGPRSISGSNCPTNG